MLGSATEKQGGSGDRKHKYIFFWPKQNNSNSTKGFRNKQMLFLNLFPMKNIQISQTNIYAC